MTRIIADISVSLDGFVTGPDPGPDSGKDLDVVLMGGGATIGSALDVGLVDALTLHLAPLVPGSGTPLFTGTAPRTLVHRSVTPTSTATHLTYDVLG
ncbi:dihydrofolate reductase family protein [Streptomyces sp. NPDC003038]|uniref:dihydrofolate reductase family protein n=1 Tax=unclassified Streptomyces TaxID=2593676 RepID=UPI0033BB0B24